MKRIRFNNRIWILAVLMALTVLSAIGAGSAVTSTLALEQAPRCGMEEHVHTEECYVGDVLVCGKKMHTHTEQCYLVLLKENNINALLSKVEESEGKSLESVIWNTVVNGALNWDNLDYVPESGGEGGLNPAASAAVSVLDPAASAAISAMDPSSSASAAMSILDPAASAAMSILDPAASAAISILDPSASTSMALEELEIQPATSADIARLNAAAEAVDVQPRVTLNERLVTLAAAEGSLTEEELLAALLNGGSGVSTYAVGDGASTYATIDPDNSSGKVNFFIQLDGEIKCIGSGSLGTMWNTYYYSTSNVVNMYNSDSIVSGLNESNIGSAGYYIRYNTNQSTTSFGTTASVNSWYGGPTFGNSRSNTNARYALLSKSTSNFDPVEFYTVTLDYSGVDSGKANQEQYVESGLSSTLTLDSEYDWYTAETGGIKLEASDWASYAIDDTITLYARPRNYTVTYENQSGTEILASTTAKPGTDGNATVKLPELPSGYETYLWTIGGSGQSYKPNDEVPITGNTTFVAVPATYTIRYYGEDGVEIETLRTTVSYNGSHTLSDQLPEGCTVWVDVDAGDSYAPGGTVSGIARDYQFRAASKVTVTYIDKDGNKTTESVTPGETVTLTDPGSGYLWVDDQGKSYASGDTVKITRDTTFTAQPTLNITYDVSFSDESIDYYYASLPASPTLVGTTATTATDTVAQGTTAAIRDITERKVVAESTGHGKGLDYPLYFAGWQTQDGTIITPGTRLTYDELEQYDTDGDGTVELTGVWEHGKIHAVNFCIAYNSQPTIGGGQTASYTDNLYTTYLGGSNIDTGYSLPLDGTVVDTSNPTDQELYESDKQLRSLYGSSGDMWLYDLPSDEDVFAQIAALINSGETFYVKGELVSADDLDADHYAIRWCVFFYDSGDGWHVDGRLVKKSGNITVDKTFMGEDEYIAKGKENFTIVAENGYQDSNGNFVPYDSSDSAYKSYELTLDDAAQTGVNSYEWVIDGLTLNELWQVTERPPTPDGSYSYYAEYSVYDSDGEISAVAEYGTEAKVVGKVFALDEDPDQGLRVAYVNYYYPVDSLLIKKEDAETGQAIPNVRFEVLQKGQTLRFDLDEETGYYTQDPGGEYPYITTGEDGYAAITGFSHLYDADNPSIIVREYQAPEGYKLAPEVTLTWTDKDTVGISGMKNEEESIDESDWNDYAEFNDGEVLIVKNYPKTISLTASKVWADETRESSVKLILLANGKRATNLFPTVQNVEVTLNAGNNWTWTWEDLPVSANGEAVEWGVRESAIGSETPTATTGEDGQITYSYARWIVSYSPPVKTDADGDGMAESWNITVTNTLRRAMLYLNKISIGKLNALPGATFRLVRVNADGTEVSGTEKTAVTNESGTLNFDNLTYGARYCLTEVSAPNGYWGYTDPIYFTITEDGKVNLEASNEYVSSNAALYTVTVANRSGDELPETGGRGRTGYYATGVMLMLLALCVTILPKIKRKGRYRMRR